MKKFELRQSPKVPHMWQIFNHQTGMVAKLKVKSLQPIRRKFAVFINSDTDFFFELMPKSETAKLIEMLPKHRV